MRTFVTEFEKREHVKEYEEEMNLNMRSETQIIAEGYFIWRTGKKRRTGRLRMNYFP